MNKLAISLAIGVVLALFLANSVFYTVDERERAILFRFGEIVKDDSEPGLHYKVPIMNTVRKFDKRTQTLDAEPERYLTSEKKNVIVDSFVKWRINNVSEFFTSTGGDINNANQRLAQIINDGLREEFGKRTIQEVVSGERSQIMEILTSRTKNSASELGLDVVDVRIRRIDLPQEVSTSVYDRMKAERERVAADLRSRGAEAAERIRAEADREATIIKAEAYRDAERVRGEGDATAADTYAKAYSKNKEFYSLYRSLNAYRNTFNSKDDVLVVKPDSEFFKYFTNSKVK